MFERAIPLVLVAIPLALVLTEVRRRRRRARGELPASAMAGAAIDVLLVLSVAGILAATLLPLSGQQSLQLVPFRTTWRTLESGEAWKILRLVGGNVLLFVPFGFFAGARSGVRSPLWHLAFAGAALSVAVETAQFLVVPGRSVEIDDVLLNTAGTVLGGVLSRTALRWAPPRWRRDGSQAASRRAGRGSARREP